MKDKNRNRKNYCWNEPNAKETQGARTCSNPNCVRPAHVIPAIEMEWWDISYRTGKKLTYQETYEKITRENAHGRDTFDLPEQA